ncbi:MAG: NADH-quinone oxidoreductase subunit N [Anaerolineae bacterium]|nr:NADH-quinone oxidoreductase subunit N [Anaerolineae bacterium]
MTINDLNTILPLVVLAGWSVVVLLADLWIPKDRKGWTAALSAVGLVVVLGLTLARGGTVQKAFFGTVLVDGFALYLDIIFLVGGLAGIALAYDYLKRMELERGEYYPLLLIAISGMMLMTYANDLIIVFLALELLSLPLYIMAGFARFNLQSEEAALKYFLLGSFASGLVLYGVALLFGASGHTDLPGLVNTMRAGTGNQALFLFGAALLLVGFSFKTGIVPFHMWMPDVYQGAPSPATAFMSVGAKAAGFAALMRVFVTVFPSLSDDLTPILWALAAITMVVGNVLAISQKNIKRLLAYSSIAQSGYLLMAFVPYANAEVSSDSIAAMLFYLLAYTLTTFGAWAVIIQMEQQERRGLEVADYAGLGKRHPWLGLAMTIFMLSFTGVPLTLGFWGKFYLFSTAVEGGFVGLALIGLLTSVVSAFYYLRVVVVMYMQPGDPPVKQNRWVNLTALLAAAVVVGLAFIPGSVLDLALQAVLQLQ